MELILLLLVAGLVGYFLAGSRYSKNIDETAGKVGDTSRSLVGRFTDWVGGLFGRGAKEPEVVDAEAKDIPVDEEEAEVLEEKKTAEKASSRRKSS